MNFINKIKTSSKEKKALYIELLIIFILFIIIVIGWSGINSNIKYPHTMIVKIIEIITKIIFVISPIITLIFVYFTNDEKKLLKRAAITMLLSSILVPIILLVINIGIIKYDQSHYEPIIQGVINNNE